MKKIILVLVLPIFLGLSYVSADDSGTGSIDTGTGTNSAPVSLDDLVSTNEDTSLEIDLLSNDTDADGDDLIIISISDGVNGEGEISNSGTLVKFTPDEDFFGTGSFDYVVSDGELTDTGSVEITVISVNDEPQADDDELETEQNMEKNIDPRENDTDVEDDILSVVGVTDGLNGTVTFTSISVTYTPNTDFVGNDSFTYTVDDGNGGTSTGQVDVVVNEEDEEEDDNNNNNNDDDNGKEKNEVKNIQKEFIAKFKELKNEYKKMMKDRNAKNQYLEKKKQLRAEYLMKLKDVTGNANDSEEENENYNKNEKNKYKNTYKKKYGRKISKLGEDGLSNLLEKIDEKIEEINDGNHSEKTKEKFNNMLIALRELVLEYMDNQENNLDIDELFE